MSKDLHALGRSSTSTRRPSVAFCTDDRNPLDIAEEGHLDYMIRTLIALGRAAASRLSRRELVGGERLRPARPRPDRAGPARRHRAGRRSRRTARCSTVIAAGRVVDDVAVRRRAGRSRRSGSISVKARAGDGGRFPRSGAGTVDAGDRRRARPHRHRAACASIVPARDGDERWPIRRSDIAKVAVVERHGKNGNIGRAFVTGFGTEARRHRLLGRPRQPQHLRRRRGRRRHGGGGQPADRACRAASSVADGGKVRGRAGAAARRPDEPRAVRGGARTA